MRFIRSLRFAIVINCLVNQSPVQRILDASFEGVAFLEDLLDRTDFILGETR